MCVLVPLSGILYIHPLVGITEKGKCSRKRNETVNSREEKENRRPEGIMKDDQNILIIQINILFKKIKFIHKDHHASKANR